jgi:hypothetical protein
MLKSRIFSKDNISNLFQNLVKTYHLENLTNEKKKDIANMVVQNLKDVYISVDENKINSGNLERISEQVNSHAYKKVAGDIAKKLSNKETPQISQVAFQREMVANPNSNIRIMNRSDDTRMGAMSRMPQSQMRDFEMTEKIDSGTLEERLANLQSQRGENNRNLRPTTPPQLRPRETNPNRTREREELRNNNRNNRNSGNNFKENLKNPNSIDTYHLTNEVKDSRQDEFMSFDSQNKQGSIDSVFGSSVNLDEDYQEDNLSLEERLKLYQNQRIDIPRTKQELPPAMETRDKKEKDINYNSKNNKNNKNNNNEYEENSPSPSPPRQIQTRKIVKSNIEYNEDNENLHTEIRRNPQSQIQTQNYNQQPTQMLDSPSLNQLPNMLLDLERKVESIMKMYQSLSNPQKFQLIVDSRKLNHQNANYRFNLSRNLDNVSKIELIHYSIPNKWYNINQDNNLFIYKLPNNDEYDCSDFTIKEHKIHVGNYTIDTLINYLNENLELNFTVSIDQKIKISYEKRFKLVPTKFLMENLNIQSKEKEFEFSFEADGSWDLREMEFIVLYLNNLDSENPIAILHPNGKSLGKIEFEYPQTLNHLDIRMETPSGKIVDFQGRYHSLTFVIETV